MIQKAETGRLFPVTPGDWLLLFRERLKRRGEPLSRDELGAYLGVSGRTVRRWEMSEAKSAGELQVFFAKFSHWSEEENAPSMD